MTVTADALDLLAGDPPRYPHVEGDFHRHPETGAPYVNHPTETRKDGTPKRVMYGRPSSFGSALDNPYNLVKWKERQLLIGASILEQDANDRALGGPIFDLDPDDRDALDGLAARCHEAAGSSLAADRGTHVHKLCEQHDKRGKIDLELFDYGNDVLGIPGALQAQIVNQWIAFRDRLGLTALAVEQTVVNDRWRLAGTLDRLDVADHDILTAYGIIDAGQPFVGDIKTTALHPGKDGQPNWWTKYPVQLAAYVDAVPYDTETDERSSYGCEFGYFEPNPHIALIYHYDLARALAGEVVDWQAIPVSVDAGREGGDLCRAAADFAKRRDLFAMPAPTSPAEGNPSRHPDETDWRHARNATASDREACAMGSTSASDRDRLRARIADLIADTPANAIALRRHWPEGVPTLKHEGHTDDELAQILAAVRRVETEVCAPWHPDDGPPPHVNTNPRASVEYPVQFPVVDEGGILDHARFDALSLEYEALGSDGRILCAVVALEAKAAGRPISVTESPTVRRWTIARAVIAWAASGRSVDDLWFTASLLATFEQTRDPAATLGGLISQFTIEQAERLYEAAAT